MEAKDHLPIRKNSRYQLQPKKNSKVIGNYDSIIKNIFITGKLKSEIRRKSEFKKLANSGVRETNHLNVKKCSQKPESTSAKVFHDLPLKFSSLISKPKKERKNCDDLQVVRHKVDNNFVNFHIQSSQNTTKPTAQKSKDIITNGIQQAYVNKCKSAKTFEVNYQQSIKHSKLKAKYSLKAAFDQIEKNNKKLPRTNTSSRSIASNIESSPLIYRSLTSARSASRLKKEKERATIESSRSFEESQSMTSDMLKISSKINEIEENIKSLHLSGSNHNSLVKRYPSMKYASNVKERKGGIA